MAILASSDDIVTPEFRMAFPYLTEKRQWANSKPAYQMTMLFPKETDIAGGPVEPLRNAARSVATEAFGSDPAVLSALRVPFLDGDTKPDVNGFPGHTVVRAKSQHRPPLLGSDGQDLVDASGIYGGCWCVGIIQFFAYDTNGNRGVSTTFSAVKFVRDGDRFGGSDPSAARAKLAQAQAAEDNPANYAAAPSTAQQTTTDPFGA